MSAPIYSTTTGTSTLLHQSTLYMPTCEQVTHVKLTEFEPMLSIIQTCDQTVATHFLEWTDDAGLGQMHMCEQHKDEFLDEAEVSDVITGVYVEKIVYNNDPRNVVGFL
jgi:hypothetical protein